METKKRLINTDTLAPPPTSGLIGGAGEGQKRFADDIGGKRWVEAGIARRFTKNDDCPREPRR